MKTKALKVTFIFCSLFISAGWYVKGSNELATSSEVPEDIPYQFLSKETMTTSSAKKGQSEADLMLQNIKNKMEENKKEIDANQETREMKRDPSASKAKKDERILNPEAEQIKQGVQPILDQIRQRWAQQPEIIQLLDQTSSLMVNMKEKTQTLYEWSLNAKDQKEEEKTKKIQQLLDQHNQVLQVLVQQENQLKAVIHSHKALKSALIIYNRTLDEETKRLKESINGLIASWYK